MRLTSGSSRALTALVVALLLTFGTVAAQAAPYESAEFHLDSQSNGSTPDSAPGQGLNPANDVVAGTVAGRFSNAFQLTNTGDGFTADDSSALEPGSVTAMAWVKRSGTPGNYRTIVGKGALSCSDSAYALYTGSAGGLQFYVTISHNGVHTVVKSPALAASSVWDGQWHAIAGTFDAATGATTLWLDGKNVGSTQAPSGAIDYSSYVSGKNDLTVGRFDDSSCALAGFQYTGAIDEVRVYQGAMRPYELAYLQDPSATSPRELPAPPPAVFTDFTSLESGVAHGTLAGRSVSLTASGLSSGATTLDGTNTVFDTTAFTPPLTHSDALSLTATNGGTFALHFGRPVTNPVFHFSSLGATVTFPAGAQVTKVSGDTSLTVSGRTVTGTQGDGTVSVSGTYTDLTFTTSTGASDAFALEVGIAVGAHDNPLIARFPFDLVDDGTTADFSGHAIDADTANPAAIVPGRFGNAFDLDGTGTGATVPENNEVTPSGENLLEPPGSFSLVAWVKSDGSLPGDDKVVVYKGGEGCRDPAYGFGTGANGGLEFDVQFRGPGTYDYNVTRSTPIDPASIWDGNWHSVVGVFNQAGGGTSRSVSLWVDGARVGYANVPDGRNDAIDWTDDHIADEQLTVGFTTPNSYSHCTDTRAFHGAIDELRFYDSALTDRDIGFLVRPDHVDPPDLDDNQAPVNTARPALSGTPQVGDTLSCTPGTWTGNQNHVSYVTTWERAPHATTADDDPNWTAIEGATGPQYAVQADDAGSRVRCHVTRMDDGGSADAVSPSLRADTNIPVESGPPTVTGVPATRRPAGTSILDSVGITCQPGTWSNNPDFEYQWLRNGAEIAGATSKTYVPKPTRDQGSAVASHPDGDGGQDLSCRVTASNDVGSAAAVTTATVRIVDDVPLNATLPSVSFVQRQAGVADTDAVATCVEGDWIDGYGLFREDPYTYSYQWLRNGAPIAGATDRKYTFTSEDLGREISCVVTDQNPLGSSQPATSPQVLIPLPAGPSTATIYRAGTENGASPTDLLAVSDQYVAAINNVIATRLQTAVDAARTQCQSTYKGAKSAPPDRTVVIPALGTNRCRILLYDYDHVSVNYQGVRYLTGSCTPLSQQATPSNPPCKSLGFDVPAIDPKNPPAADPSLLAAVKDATPVAILWDIDGNGTTDAICPGSAPVLRTILGDGNWNPRAVIVNEDSAGSLSYPNATLGFHAPFSTSGGGNGALRDSQVKVCATAFDPPPDPQTAPCITTGTVGDVAIAGNICPIDVRSVSPSDYDALGGQAEDLLRSVEENKVAASGTATSRSSDGNRGGTIYVPLNPHSTRTLRSGPVSSTVNSITGAANSASNSVSNATATLDNTAASLSSVGSTAISKVQNLPSSTLNSLQGAASSFVPTKGNFALDQLYSATGGLTVNGAVINPVGDAATLLVPSDVHDGLTDVENMTISQTNGIPQLGPVGDASAIPLAVAGQIHKTIDDTISQAQTEAEAEVKDQLQQLNVDDLEQQLKDQAAKAGKSALDALKAFDLGPFKLAGDAHVTLNNDGTATLKAYAELPGLSIGPGKGNIRTDVTITGDEDGHLKLQGLHFHASLAYLGGAKLSGLDFTEANGLLDIKGEIDIPPPAAAGIIIKDFSIDKNGPESLDVDYLGGPGSSIPVGPGTFITRIGAGFSRLTNILDGDTTVSVGPSVGGGCPTVGIEADFQAHLADPFSLDAHGALQVACFDLVQMKFHADQSGLVELGGGVDYHAGPLFIKGSAEAKIKLPNWQLTIDASGGIKGIPVDVGVSGVLSNLGIAACGRVKLLFIDLAAGVGETFPGGHLPLSPSALAENFHLFTGCDLSAYRPLGAEDVVRAAGGTTGGKSFTLPPGGKPVLLSFVGAGSAPRVILHSPDGQTFDYSNATGDRGATIGASLGSVIDDESRTVVILGKPTAGKWTADIAPGSTGILRINQASVLPQPSITAKILGHGSSRKLKYHVAAISGQVVRFFESAKGGETPIATVKAGGDGTKTFTVSEASAPARTIVAEVSQDGMPRKSMTLAHFSAPSPRVQMPPHVRVTRNGSKALVSWHKATFAKAYEVSVTYGTGETTVIDPKRGATHVTVPDVMKSEGLQVGVVAFSPTGHRSTTARATLGGDMRVGAQKVKKLVKPKGKSKKHHATGKKH